MNRREYGLRGALIEKELTVATVSTYLKGSDLPLSKHGDNAHKVADIHARAEMHISTENPRRRGEVSADASPDA